MSDRSLLEMMSNVVTRRSGTHKMADALSSKEVQGVYVSVETLLDLRHRATARSRKYIGRVHGGLPGEILSSRKGPGIEFEDIRPYLPGDDIRHIDWRVAARTGLPYTRRYTEERERSVMIVCDQRVNMFFGSGAYFKSYRAAIAAARMAWIAFEQNHRLGGVIASETLEAVIASNPKRAVLTYCNRLACHNGTLNSDSQSLITLEHMIDLAGNNMTPGMVVTVISDFNDLNSRSTQTLTAMAKQGVLTLQQVIDPIEDEMKISGRVGISDGERIKQVVVSRKVREAYLRKRAAVSQRLEDLVNLSGAELLSDDSGYSA